MQSIVDYAMMTPAVEHHHHRRSKKTRRELRRQTALAEQDIDMCSSPPRRQLPPRNEKMDALREKMATIQQRLNKIESKAAILDSNKCAFMQHPTRLSTIVECDDETSPQEEQWQPHCQSQNHHD